MDRKLEEVEWLLSYARNANRLIRVAPAITTKKVNAPRRLTPTRSLNPVTHPQKMKSAHTPEINPEAGNHPLPVRFTARPRQRVVWRFINSLRRHSFSRVATSGVSISLI
jgi:hypothetical protein